MCVSLLSPCLHQAGSKDYSLEDHKKHMLSIQAELEEMKQLWEPPAAAAIAGGGAGGDKDKVGTAALVNPVMA